ncbi:glycoside hydrolase family 99-like domain-containing protein [Thermoactinomyces daqus]|uniref:Glycoside hydrolase family 99-like domain-containing protein n=1 Tax=Thermoactinomyces daqus TaxID=1329516 RepID=A0A7W1XDF7_9BACL|nr:glycoside hydrolase family 99-like domain-containing protein [Thermoactinomyces daqus]MBA4544508.1 glycoside hydrolase family 99-like domain-containing protein [Thermoactinomyces daqus]
MINRLTPKVIAFYLPQFHRIPENDRWWGPGFTEWTNTRKAVPLFPGHYQPREPYRDYYYYLTDPEARQWQANIAREYGVYGFCYYHYWFKGKMLLETPFNEVLRTGEPDFPFCLCWANHHWRRTWIDGSDHDEFLMIQEYGDYPDWKIHFEYLLEAFKDKRYIRVDNKPLFSVYVPWHIERLDEMFCYWDQLAKQNGLDGIYFAEVLSHSNPNPHTSSCIHARIDFEPFYTIVQHHQHNLASQLLKHVTGFDSQAIRLYDYDTVWQGILNRVPLPDKPAFLGAFIDWDNTARMGKNALIFDGASPDKFGYYFSQLIQKAIQIKSEFVFINAWNEWSEGTYLEPDKRYGFGYLEQVKKSTSILNKKSTFQN